MNELRMPTTLPSPVDRGQFAFVAVDGAGIAWRWVDEELVWARLEVETHGEDGGPDACDVLH